NVSPDAIAVELCADASGALPASVTPMRVESAIAGATHGYRYTARTSAQRPETDYTARIRPCHAQARIPAECACLHWEH
ncbi:hypothetical protein ABTM34_20460, partial [Acinetobacter baumannii]